MPKGNARIAMLVVGALVVGTLATAGASYEAELADARAAVTGSDTLATAGPGYFDATLLAAVPPMVTLLQADLPDAGPAAAVLKEPERPTSTAELNAAAESFDAWVGKTKADVESEKASMGAVEKNYPAAHDAILAVARTVTAQAAAALAGAPSASADTRSAVNSARDAVLAALRSGGDPVPSVKDYIDKVASMNASQAAAAAAASAAAAAAANSGGGGGSSGGTPLFPFPIVAQGAMPTIYAYGTALDVCPYDDVIVDTQYLANGSSYTINLPYVYSYALIWVANSWLLIVRQCLN